MDKTKNGRINRAIKIYNENFRLHGEPKMNLDTIASKLQTELGVKMAMATLRAKLSRHDNGFTPIRDKWLMLISDLTGVDLKYLYGVNERPFENIDASINFLFDEVFEQKEQHLIDTLNKINNEQTS